MEVDIAPGAAMRRRQRRLRQFMRHELLTVAMALAEATHHTAPRRRKAASAITVNDAPTGTEERRRRVLRAELRRGRGVCEGDAAGSALGERVQRHTVEQMIESFVPVPMLDLDASVPQLVDQPVVVLQFLDMFTSVEQGIEVPKITLEDGIPQRAVLREPLPVEQLADVPVPETVILARGRCALGVVWYHVAARGCGGAAGGWVARSMSSGAREGPPPAQGGRQILGAVVRRRAVPQIQEQILVGDVPVLMKPKFQQSESYLSVNVPQTQFIVILVAFSCATETGTHSASCAGIRDSSAVLG